MPEIVALETRKVENGKVKVTDSKGSETVSRDPAVLLSALVAPHDGALKVCWDMQTFLAPLVKLLPADVVKKLNNGEPVWFGEFKLFYGVGKGAVFGVTWRINEQVKGNIWNVEEYEANVYDVHIYFSNESEPDVRGLREKGDYLLKTLQNMGMSPTKLTSPAAIYEESILRKLPIPTVYDMPEEALEMVEWCANYVREWRSCYKIGYFEHAFDYDLSGAYPSALAGLPNLNYARYIYASGLMPEGDDIYWGIMKGKLNITAEVTPLVRDDGSGYKGEYEDYVTTDEVRCIQRWRLGTFKPMAGWFVIIPRQMKIFDYAMRRLYALRNGDDLQNRLAKNMAASTWGRFIERRGDKFGNYYMPPYAAMTTSRIRCAVCDFIYGNRLQDDSLLSVTVDGCLTTKHLPNVSTERKFGEWRANPESPALVLSSAFQWTGDKRPAGVNLSQMLSEIQRHPMSRAWHGVALRFLEHDRQFPDGLPKNGHDIMDRVYQSKAIEIG